MMKEFENKIAVVTGASQGIGKKIAQDYIAQGGTVIGTGRREEMLREVERELGDAFIGVPCDAGKVEDITALIEMVSARFGKLDLLVNNAGSACDDTPETIEEKVYDSLMNVLLKGPVFHVKHAAELLRRSDDGNVINISAGAAHVVMPNYCPYAYAKVALEKFTVDSVIQVPGIRHNCVIPGYIDTPILKQIHDSEGIEGVKKLMSELTPAKRIGNVEDVSNIVLFLASRKSAFINGSRVLVDGGLTTLNVFNT
jgi:NAD(P)-dependent dehydrogenase (short-subunit alcohol dehydrogenase family)